MSKAVFAGGCFWCLEAVFRKISGVKNTVAGYSGGKHPNPCYERVCSGATGHAEAVEIEYDENIISYDRLLDIFFNIHDPSELNRQGNDVGSQYRSAVFYCDGNQRRKALEKIEELKNSGIKVVTEVTKLDRFYPAEEYHQNYFFKNPAKPYCMYVIEPKIKKFFNN